MHYHALSQPYNFGAETHLGGGDASAFVVPSARSLSSTLVASTVLRKPHKDSDHTAVIAVIRRCSHAETHRAGEAVSAVIIKFLSSLWTPLPTQSTKRGPHLTCVNWNELQRVACTGCIAATRSAVAPRDKTAKMLLPFNNWSLQQEVRESAALITSLFAVLSRDLHVLLAVHMMTMWWPHDDHMVTMWWWHDDHMMTTWWPHDDHVMTTWWPHSKKLHFLS